MARSDPLRRAGPLTVVGLALLLGALSAGYTWIMVRHLRNEARDTSRLLGRVFAGLNDPGPEAVTGTLLDLAARVRALGIPIVVTDTNGHVTAMDNVPPRFSGDTARMHTWIASLDLVNRPIVQPGVGTIHYGELPQTEELILLAALQAIAFICLVALAARAYRAQVAAARDRLWVAMARESAHQLGTPLMGLTGWIDYLQENPDTRGKDLVEHLEADVDRLERVARRFEHIGRPAKMEAVALGALAERVVTYFRPRLPTLASPVTLTLAAPDTGPTASADPVLVEWALEALIKNSIDALSGRGGRIDVRLETAGPVARVRVRDDGPGVPAQVRAHLFEPGVTSKPGGWGIGLALARRIVEQQHRGRIFYHPMPAGSEFVLEFPLAAPGSIASTLPA